MTRFASLGSGSEGNCLIFEAGATRVLVDCGFKPKEAQTRLERLGVEPASLSGIVVTHEHSDHAGGVFALARLYNLGVWLTHGTLAAMREPDPDAGRDVACHIIDGQLPFAVGDARVEPFTVPHDAREPVQFVLSDGARRLGVLTDAGCSTPRIQESLTGCDALVLEANHDLDMLWNGAYPKWLKQRIAGPFGHLDNEDSARLIGALDCSRLKHVVGAHLSQQNNRPEIVRTALARALNCEESWIGLATQDEGFGWRSL